METAEQYDGLHAAQSPNSVEAQYTRTVRTSEVSDIPSLRSLLVVQFHMECIFLPLLFLHCYPFHEKNIIGGGW